MLMTYLIYSILLLGYEPASLAMHPPSHLKKTKRQTIGGFIFCMAVQSLQDVSPKNNRNCKT